jgi:hypothetical protein
VETPPPRNRSRHHHRGPQALLQPIDPLVYHLKLLLGLDIAL